MSRRQRRPLFRGSVPLPSCLALLLAAVPVSATPLPLGSELQVNTVTTFQQRHPDIAIRPDRSFVVVWQSYATEDWDIRGQLFTSTGEAIGNELLVNDVTTGNQNGSIGDAAQVATDAAGRFVVVWQSDYAALEPLASLSVQARRFESDGTPIGGQFQVNGYTTGNQYEAAVDMAPDGRFVIAWAGESAGPDTDESVRAQRFASDGSPVGAEIEVPTTTTGTQKAPNIAMASDGSFVVVWSSEYSAGTDTSSESIQVQRFASDGSKLGSELQVNTYTTFTQLDPDLHMAADGSFVVVWESDGSDTEQDDAAQGRRFASDGTPIGDEFALAAYTTGDQNDADVLMLDNGGFVAAWQSSEPQDGSGVSILGRRFASDGSSVGTDFVLSTITAYDQFNPTMAQIDDDTLVFVFDSDPTDTGAADVKAQRFQLERIAGRVFVDANANGLRDGGEAGQPGVSVTLFDAFDVQVAQTTTDAGGHYRFDVGIGAYYLIFDLPTSFQFSPQDVGSDDAIDSDAASDGRTLVFSAVEAVRGWDAGLVPLDVPTVAGRVWSDDDRDGIQDGGELGFQGVSIELFHQDGMSQDTTTSDSGGSYTFMGIVPGTYYLRFSEPAGFCYTAADQGNDDSLDSDVDPASFTTALFTIADGQIINDLDAGLVPDASIGDRVWMDNGDGIQDGGEPGVSGVTVNLYSSAGVELDSTTTDGSGSYGFSPGPGNYYLEFVLPTDMAFAPRDQGADDGLDSDASPATGTTPVFTLGPGTVSTSFDAGLEPAVIGNRVWIDANADGRQQPGEDGLAGVIVRLLDAADTEVASMTTSPDGLFGFVGIGSGDYRLEVVLPPDGVFSSPNAGGDDLIDSDVDPATGRTALFAYTAGTAARGHDAGLRLLPLFEDGFENGSLSAWSSSVQ